MASSEDIMWQAVEFGTPGSLEYRVVYLDKQGRAMSPWHSIPLLTGVNEYHFLCQSPRGTWARFEAADDEDFNPLRICRVEGKPAHFAENCKWNYGMLPQTWADSALNNADYGGIPYDGKPIEVLEIGSRVSHTGEVYKVKILCAFGVIIPKSGTLAWKIVAIASDDLMANTLANVADVNQSLPDTLEEIREWLRTCHCFLAEDEENVFGMNERAAGAETGLEILVEGHAAWQLLHQGLPVPQAWPPRGEILQPATLESLWSKYTDHLPHPLPIPVCDDGRGVEESGGGSSRGTVGANQGRKLLSFLTSKSRFTRPAFFQTSGDKAGGRSSDSKALPPKSGWRKSMGNLDQPMAADSKQSAIPAQPAVSERGGGGGSEGAPYACRVQEAGNIGFGTTIRRAGDAIEIADSRVDGKGSPPPAPTASSGEGADVFRDGGESSEGAGQGEGVKKAMGNETLGGPVTVIPVATVSAQEGKSGWTVGFEFPEKGFGFETAQVDPSELDGCESWAQAEAAGAGGKAQEEEVWKQTALSPRNAEARVEGESGGRRGRRRGHRATQSVSFHFGEHGAEEEAAESEWGRFVRSTSLGAGEVAAVMSRLQLGLQADDRGAMYAEVGEGGDMYGREEEVESGGESGTPRGGGRGEEWGYGGREGAGGKKVEWSGQEELGEVEYLDDDGEVVVVGGGYGSGVTGRSRDSRSPSNRGGNWEEEEEVEEEEWSYGEEEEGVEVARNISWQGVDADIPVAVVLTAYGSKGGQDVYVDEREEATYRVGGSQMGSYSSTPPSSRGYGDDFGERVGVGNYGVYEDDHGERRKTPPLSPSFPGHAPRRTGEQIRAERRAEREREERERRGAGRAGVGGDWRGGGREVETWREEEQPRVASKKSAADLQWEEALRQVSKTMGKKVLLNISKEEQAVFDETQRVGQAITRAKTSRRY